MRVRCAFGVLSVLLAGAPVASVPAFAGPPYVTDDPEPTDPGHWEIYNFVGGVIEGGVTSSEVGVDLNYGAAKNLQLTATLPLDVDSDRSLRPGDVELAVKYKFLHQHTGGFPLDVGFFPRVFLPSQRGKSRAQLLLPLWAEHDWGRWSLFGGGGYTLNPGAGNRDFWQQGVALTRLMRPGFSLGLEYYGQGPASTTERAIHGLNLGTQIHLHGPFSLLGSFGQGLSAKQTIFYTALKLDL